MDILGTAQEFVVTNTMDNNHVIHCNPFISIVDITTFVQIIGTISIDSTWGQS